MHLIFSGSKFNCCITSDIHSIVLFNHYDKSVLHVFEPFYFIDKYLGVGSHHKILINILT